MEGSRGCDNSVVELGLEFELELLALSFTLSLPSTSTLKYLRITKRGMCDGGLMSSRMPLAAMQRE